MAQIFGSSWNRLPRYVALGVVGITTLLVGGIWYWGSPRYTDVGYRPVQPVPYSHKLHVADLGLDCRYCHASVEVSDVANVPPTKVCMNCHATVLRDSQALAPIRASATSGRPMRWVRVHNLPDYAYFSHRAHVAAGVGCVTCHGRIDQMEVVTQEQPLSMGWCLDCHRDPAPWLRPPAEVTNMEWSPSADHATFAAQRIRQAGISPPTDCSGCHR